MGPVLFERDGLGCPSIHLRAAAFDLRIRGLGDAGLRLAIQAPDQRECEPRTLLGGQSQDLDKNICGSHAGSVAVSAHNDIVSKSGEERIALDPEAPGLDEDTRQRRRSLAELQRLSIDELFQVAVRAGIYTPDGELTPPYRDDGEPSACRPTD